MATIRLKSLQCILNDEVDKDEVYLKLDGKKIWPAGMYKQINSGEKIDMNLSFQHSDEQMRIELWDFDFLSKNDLLGAFTIAPHGERGNFTVSMLPEREGTTASYILEWEARD